MQSFVYQNNAIIYSNTKGRHIYDHIYKYNYSFRGPERLFLMIFALQIPNEELRAKADIYVGSNVVPLPLAIAR